jgi:hypothetical protein
LWELCPFELKISRNMHNYIWYTYYLPSFMKFCSVVSDGQDKNNMSPHKRNNKILLIWSIDYSMLQGYPLNLEISRNLLLKQLVSATPLKLLNRNSWNLVGSKDTICSCAYYHMNFCSVVSEELSWQTVWRTDGQDKNNMSPHQSWGRHNIVENGVKHHNQNPTVPIAP